MTTNGSAPFMAVTASDDLLIGDSNTRIVGKRSSEDMISWNDSDLYSIITGKIVDDESSSPTNLISICESRGSMSEIGVTVFDSIMNTCLLLQILMCSSSSENSRSKLYNTLLDVVPVEVVHFINRSEFNEIKGKEIIERLCIKNLIESVLFGCSKKYFAFASISAMFSFVEQDLSIVFSENSLKFLMKSFDGILVIDYHTCKSLELICNNQDRRNNLHLFGVICNCQTLMGKRFLKSNILQPLTNLVEIRERQDAIQELVEDEEYFQKLKEQLKNFPDIDNFISSLIRKESGLDPKTGDELIHRALILKKILNKIRKIKDIFNEESEGNQGGGLFLNKIYEDLSREEVNEMMDFIDDVISEDIDYHQKEGLRNRVRYFAVKESISNGLLQVARRTLKESESDIYEYVETWSGQIGLNVNIKYQEKRGYYLTVKREKEIKEEDLIRIIGEGQFKVSRSEISFSTMDLIKLNGRVKESINEILLASQSVLMELFDKIRDKIDILYEISSGIGKLDFIIGLTGWAGEHGCIRPDLCNDSQFTLTIRNSRHPILQSRFCSAGINQLVPNDYLSCKWNSFTIVTGVNMSGKSTYAKQLALLVILVQIGSFIPAEYGLFPIYERILTRLGSDDELESNASSFKMEMKESSYLLECLTDRSLVIIDELGRGTGYVEGLGLALTICEEILLKNATVLFVTHFKQLVSYLKMNPKVSTVHLDAEISEIRKDLKFLYRAKCGVVDIENYGLKVAQTYLPSELIKISQTILSQITTLHGTNESAEFKGVRKMIERRRKIIQTGEKIKFILSGSGPEGESRKLIEKIREDFENDVDEIEEEN